jgi:hypothetical protein
MRCARARFILKLLTQIQTASHLSSTSGFPESEETDGNFIKYIIMGDEI